MVQSLWELKTLNSFTLEPRTATCNEFAKSGSSFATCLHKFVHSLTWGIFHPFVFEHSQSFIHGYSHLLRIFQLAFYCILRSAAFFYVPFSFYFLVLFISIKTAPFFYSLHQIIFIDLSEVHLSKVGSTNCS